MNWIATHPSRDYDPKCSSRIKSKLTSDLRRIKFIRFRFQRLIKRAYSTVGPQPHRSVRDLIGSQMRLQRMYRGHLGPCFGMREEGLAGTPRVRGTETAHRQTSGGHAPSTEKLKRFCLKLLSFRIWSGDDRAVYQKYQCLASKIADLKTPKAA